MRKSDLSHDFAYAKTKAQISFAVLKNVTDDAFI